MVATLQNFLANLDSTTAVYLFGFGLLLLTAAMLVKHKIIYPNAFVVLGSLLGGMAMLMGVAGWLKDFMRELL